MVMKKILTIAGSDSSGGAGIQADLKAMLSNDVYGMSAITALTAQNTTGVTAIMPVGEDFLRSQIEAVFSDIIPDAVKTGMIASVMQVKVIAELMKYYKVNNLVVDPVMIATSGAELANKDVVEAMISYLFPISKLITPNLSEACTLFNLIGKNIELKEEISDSDIEIIAKKLSQNLGVSVLVKGGHRKESCDDLLYEKTGAMYWFRSKKIDNSNTHGTGCTLSSAIASNLAKGYLLADSVKFAKNYINEILNSDLNLGKGSGPLDHGYINRKEKYNE